MSGSSLRVVAAVAASLAAATPLAAQQTPPTQASAPPLKRVAVSRQGRDWVGFGAQVRTRAEAWRSFGFGAAPNHDDGFVLYRALVSADMHVGGWLRGFVEAKTAVLSDRDLPGGTRPLDADDFDLQNAYLELSLAPGPRTAAAARVGRQELSFGKQRLVSPLDWTNSKRTFDAIRATGTVKDWTVDGFFGNPVQVSKSEFNKSDGAVDFGGVYGRWARAPRPLLELYWLALVRSTATFNGTTGRETRHTVGGRVARPPGRPLEFDVEIAYQFGSVGGEAIAAGMLSVDVAYSATRAPAAPRIHGGFDFATGDAATGGSVGTFNQLFPLGHAFLGFIDVIGRQNIVAANAGLGLQRILGAQADVTLHAFRRASAGDALYNAGGGVERTPGTATSRDVGIELDVTATRRIGRYLSAAIGYCVLFPGDFIRQTGAAGDIQFAYGSLQVTY